MKYFIISILVVLGAVFLYFIYGVYWTYTFNARQDTTGIGLPDTFRLELPLVRDMNGYFCITAKANDSQAKSFIIDTKATCLSKLERLQDLDANYWGRFPVPVKNTYGQQERFSLYEIDSLAIGSLILSKPLFKCISRTNALYDRLYKDVIGKDILRQFTWKFVLDDEKIILFSTKDQNMLRAESENYIRIKNGLDNNNVVLSFPLLKKNAGFDFDMGYQGELSIDKELFESLASVTEYKKYVSCRVLEKIDTTYVINGVDIEWNGITVSNCVLRYYPMVNRNLIGVKFIGRFNFILGYQLTESAGRSADLFIQLREKSSSPVSNTNSSNLGFDINPLNGNLFVTSLEIGGKAENAGLRIKDTVIGIDNGAINLSPETVLSGQVANHLSRKDTVTIKVKRDNEIIEYTIK